MKRLLTVLIVTMALLTVALLVLSATLGWVVYRMTATDASNQAANAAGTASPTADGSAPTGIPQTMGAPVATLPGQTGGTNLGGCSLFPADNIWNARVDSLPVDPNSAAFVESISASTGVHPDFGSGLWEGGPIGIPFMAVRGDQSRVNISFEYSDESDPGPYPIPPDPLIEGGPNSDGDRHILIVDQNNCILYEIYNAYPQNDGGWQAGSGAVFDLSSNALRPDTWTSADAAGLPMLPGLVRYDEVLSGRITHALRFTASPIRYAYVWPARHRAECESEDSDDLSLAPMGQRFRLRADFDVSSYSREVQVILIALKEYGMILADCGSDWFISGVPDEHWNNDDLVESLSTVTGADFEAVDISGLMVSPDSGQTR